MTWLRHPISTRRLPLALAGWALVALLGLLNPLGCLIHCLSHSQPDFAAARSEYVCLLHTQEAPLPAVAASAASGLPPAALISSHQARPAGALPADAPDLTNPNLPQAVYASVVQDSPRLAVPAQRTRLRIERPAVPIQPVLAPNSPPPQA